MLHRTCLTDVLDILTRFSFICCQPNINRTSTRHHLTISLLLEFCRMQFLPHLLRRKLKQLCFQSDPQPDDLKIMIDTLLKLALSLYFFAKDKCPCGMPCVFVLPCVCTFVCKPLLEYLYNTLCWDH